MGLLPFQKTGLPRQAAGGAPRATKSTLGKYSSRAVVGTIAAIFLLAAACSPSAHQSTWQAAGPVAARQLQLFQVLLWVMIVVFVLVEGVLLYTVVKYRRKPGQALPHQTHGNTPLEIAWTIIPTILILGVGGWSVATLFYLDKPPASAGKPLNVTVIGHQWWWEFEYPNADGSGKAMSTANELRVPVNRPIYLTLRSDDVIHSFWVPKLAGKTDMIPTRTNHMWFMAEETGNYYGQCAELCGAIHALMKFRVRVLSEADYNAWVKGYGQPPLLSDQARKGQAVFQGAGTCAVCHTSTGADNRQIVEGRMQGFLSGGSIAPGPNLTDLATRYTIAAGLVDLNRENLRKWVANPDNFKPGNHMAARASALYQNGGNAKLSDAQVSELVEYLMSLK
ncbi:MAG: cytochrome c oxidase subunit II [SAR202 cluster bacterium]|nr:cytochrome c oxidase subunit II [SAR202 cluster bacterium]